jgi:hypothetical protein
METSLEFLSLTEAEKVMDYYENQPGQPRCSIVPIPDRCGVVWRLEVMRAVMGMGRSARHVTPEFVTAESASVGAL